VVIPEFGAAVGPGCARGLGRARAAGATARAVSTIERTILHGVRGQNRQPHTCYAQERDVFFELVSNCGKARSLRCLSGSFCHAFSRQVSASARAVLGLEELQLLITTMDGVDAMASTFTSTVLRSSLQCVDRSVITSG
jgi:hypothetical protein